MSLFFCGSSTGTVIYSSYRRQHRRKDHPIDRRVISSYRIWWWGTWLELDPKDTEDVLIRSQFCLQTFKYIFVILSLFPDLWCKFYFFSRHAQLNISQFRGVLRSYTHIFWYLSLSPIAIFYRFFFLFMRSSLFFNFVRFCAILLIFIGISASPRSQPLIAQVFELFFLLCALYFAIRWGSRRCAASSNGKASKKPSTVCIPSRRMKLSKKTT